MYNKFETSLIKTGRTSGISPYRLKDLSGRTPNRFKDGYIETFRSDMKAILTYEPVVYSF